MVIKCQFESRAMGRKKKGRCEKKAKSRARRLARRREWQDDDGLWRKGRDYLYVRPWQGGRWVAILEVDGDKVMFGPFDTELEAAEAVAGELERQADEIVNRAVGGTD